MEKIEENKRWLSKSQISVYRQCPYKWFLLYIEKIKTKTSPAMLRGVEIHSNIENFYKNIDVVKGEIVPKESLGELGQFMNFAEKRLANCPDIDKYFKPKFQELKIMNDELKLQGYIDAIFVNPKDDGIIIVDWKTGKYRPESFSSYRFELAVYAELYRLEKGITPKYWCIYFVDADKLFFEEVKSISIKAMYKAIDKVREGIEIKNYKPKPGVLCPWCPFSEICEEWR